MQYFGVFDLSNANSGRNAYPNNKLYFQTWLTEMQHRMSLHAEYSHISIQGVHPGYVQTNIWVPPSKSTKAQSAKPAQPKSWLDWTLNKLLHYVGIDSQQGSLCITNAATAPARGLGQGAIDGKAGAEGRYGGRYLNRIWDDTPMPQTKNEGCRRAVWQFANEELKLSEKGLLGKLGN
jgi:hypothetical protein